MLKISSTNKFQKDLILCQKRNYDLNMLIDIVDILRIPETLPAQNKDHNLKGNFKGKRECHIAPDWLLIYQQSDDELMLFRTGTHSDLFKK